MGKPVVNGCCCFFSNRDGSIAIAVLQLVFGCFSLIMNLAFLTGLLKESHFEQHDLQLSEEAVTDIKIAGVLWTIATIIIASLLIHGVRKNKRGLMIPWLCMNLLALIIGALAVMAGVSFIIATGVDVASILIFTLICLIGYSIGLHFFLVIYSHFRELENLVPTEEGAFVLPPPYTEKGKNGFNFHQLQETA